MGGNQKSVKTKCFLGQLCDEKNSVPYPSGNFRGCGAEFFCDRRQEILPDFAVAKNVNPAFVQQKMPKSRNRTSDTRIFSPLLYQLSYLGISSGDRI